MRFEADLKPSLKEATMDDGFFFFEVRFHLLDENP